MLHKFRMAESRIYYTSRYTSEGVVRRAKKDGYLSTSVFGLNPNTPLKDAQDPCSALLGAQVSVPFPVASVSVTYTDMESSNLCTFPLVTSAPTRSVSMLYLGEACICRQTTTRTPKARLRQIQQERR